MSEDTSPSAEKKYEVADEKPGQHVVVNENDVSQIVADNDDTTKADRSNEEGIVTIVDTSGVGDDGHDNKKDSKNQSASKTAWSHSRREQDMFAGYEDVNLDDHLPIGFIVTKMKHFVRDGKLRVELFVFVPFLILFLFFSLTDMDIQQSHMGVGALRATFAKKFIPSYWRQRDAIMEQINAGAPVQNDRVDKTFADIESADDWADWFHTIINEVWQCGDLTKNGTSTASNLDFDTQLPRVFKGQLIPIGAMRVTTKRVKKNSCTLSNDVVVDKERFGARYNLTDFSCYASHRNVNEETLSPRCNLQNPFKNASLYEYKPCSAVPGALTTTDQGVYDCGGYIVEVPFSASCAQVNALLSLMKMPDCSYLDDIATRFVIVEAFFYSPNLDIHYSVKMINEVTTGGAWISTTQLRTMIVFSGRRIGKVILEFFFLSYVLYYMLAFFVNVRQFYIDEGVVMPYFTNIWTVLEMVNVVCYIAVFILRWMWWSESNDAKTAFPYDDTYPALDKTLYLYSQMRYALAFNFILTFLKILKFLKMSNKLNVLALTFEKCQSDVLGLLLLFTLVVTSYALAGTSIFGPMMREFSSIDRAFSSLMFMLLGVMDYEAMKSVNRGLAGLYFWSYLIISFFLILNFIVAVISEAFTQAGEAEFAPPLDESLSMVLDEIIYTLRPSSLKNRVLLFVKAKKSQNFLHGQVLTYVSQLALHKQLENPTALDNLVTPREIIKFLPSNLRREYAPFFKHEWEVVRREFILHSDSSEEQTKMVRKVAIVGGLRKGLKNKDLGKLIDPAIDRAERIMMLGSDAHVALAKKLGVNVHLQSMGARPTTREGRPQSAASRLAQRRHSSVDL